MDFDSIYDEFAECVYSYLRFKLGDQYVAEDIMQDTFMAVYKQIDQVDAVTSLKTWILTIAHHKMVDWLRKKQLTQSSLDESVSDEAFVTSIDESLSLRHTLGKFDQDVRTIIYGLYVEGMTCQELGSILGIPEGTVKSKAYYGRSKLRTLLSDKEGLS